jgi:hypothetical protein
MTQQACTFAASVSWSALVESRLKGICGVRALAKCDFRRSRQPMARRELLDVAAGIAGSFVSRNNDGNGYWGLGLLRSHADRTGTRSLRLDILGHDADPPNSAPALVADAYRQVLERQLAIRKLARGVITKAEILLTFDPDSPNTPGASTYGAPFSCTVRLTDHRGRVFERIRTGCCAPHNPLTELRSARAREAP